MRSYRHFPDTYDKEFPHDVIVSGIREDLQKLNESKWEAFADETDLDRKHRVEMAYNQLFDPYEMDKIDAAERQAAGEQWIDDRYSKIAGDRFLENDRQADHDLKVGGQFAREVELEKFKEDALGGKEPELNAVIDDRTDRQSARREYITNHLIEPALDSKLQELGLDKVQEDTLRKSEPEQIEDKAAHYEQVLQAAGSPSMKSKEEEDRDHTPDH